MLNISLVACKKVELCDLQFVMRQKVSKPYRDVDLDPTMPNIKLVRAIFIYHNVFKLHARRSITLSFPLIEIIQARTPFYLHCMFKHVQ